MIFLRPFFIINLVLIGLFTESTRAQGQNHAITENRLAYLYSKINHFIPGDADSLRSYSDTFETEFTHYIQSTPQSLHYPFKTLLDSGFQFIQTSSDRNFRTYSWDLWVGGSMHFFKVIYQWQYNGKVFSKIPDWPEGDAGCFYSKIYTVDIGGTSYYLAISNSIFSSKDSRQSIAAFKIENGLINDSCLLFRTKTRSLNSIDVDFDFFSVVDHPERPLELIKYDPRKKLIYIPLVGDKGKVTKKYLLYQLKGSQFEFVKNQLFLGNKKTDSLRE